MEDEPLGKGGPFLKWLKEERARIEEISDRRGTLSVVVCNSDLFFDVPAEKMYEIFEPNVFIRQKASSASCT